MEKTTVQTEMTTIDKVCPFRKETITTSYLTFIDGIETKTVEHFLLCEGIACVFAHVANSKIYCYRDHCSYQVGTIQYIDTEVEEY